MVKAKKSVKKSAVREVVAALDVTAKPVALKKPVQRAASRLKKARSARSARSAREALQSSPAQSEKVAAAVAVVSEAYAVKPVPAVETDGKKVAVPRKGFLNAACFWAGSVLSDSNAFFGIIEGELKS